MKLLNIVNSLILKIVLWRRKNWDIENCTHDICTKQFIHGCNSNGRAGDVPWSLQKHPRDGRLLSVWFTVSCDRRIFVRACLHFVSFCAVSRFVLFPHSLIPPPLFLSPCAIYDPVVFSYAFNPSFFFARNARPSHATRSEHLAYPCACVRNGEGTRAHARGGEPYVGLMSAIMT